MRRTKILATMGPAIDSLPSLDMLFLAGVDAVRINCSHGTSADWQRHVESVREASERMGRPIGVLVDLQGPKIRLSGEITRREVQVGERVVFSGDGAADAVAVEWSALHHAVDPERSQVVIGDGMPRFAVMAVKECCNAHLVVCRCIQAGALEPRKGVFVTHAQARADALTEKDREDLRWAMEVEADFIALSFVRSAGDVHMLRALLEEAQSSARIMAKIEKIEALDNLTEIIAAADAVMVARGDLGVEAGVARVPLLQKRICLEAIQAGKLCVTATQMLESMVSRAEPTRAEAADVANAVLDGSSAVMLSGETAVGAYPLEAVRHMAAIALDAQEGVPVSQGLDDQGDSTSEAVMHAAVVLAREVGARAIVCPTVTGGSVRAAVKYRPRREILALAHHPRVARQLTLEWGVTAHAIPEKPLDLSLLMAIAMEHARQAFDLRAGERIVITHGPRTMDPGATNMVMVRSIPEG